jgi:hypothetical protein
LITVPPRDTFMAVVGARGSFQSFLNTDHVVALI